MGSRIAWLAPFYIYGNVGAPTALSDHTLLPSKQWDEKVWYYPSRQSPQGRLLSSYINSNPPLLCLGLSSQRAHIQISFSMLRPMKVGGLTVSVMYGSFSRIYWVSWWFVGLDQRNGRKCEGNAQSFVSFPYQFSHSTWAILWIHHVRSPRHNRNTLSTDYIVHYVWDCTRLGFCNVSAKLRKLANFGVVLSRKRAL